MLLITVIAVWVTINAILVVVACMRSSQWSRAEDCGILLFGFYRGKVNMIGMMWFDNDKGVNLTAKVIKAATYYQEKYGKRPNFCYMHPNMVVEKIDPIDGIEVQTSRQIMPNHFWLGIKNGNMDVS